jgi:hypothetical protein
VSTALVLDALAACGVLFVQDKRWPSVASIVAGDEVRGSWWGHPRGHEIFALLGRLEDHDDVVFVKLLDGKVTLVHRALWPALVGVACARAPWQTDGLGASARALLDAVDEGGAVRAAGPDAKRLDARLLARVRQVHTESGAHALELTPWSTWAAQQRVVPLAADAAMDLLDDLVAHGREAFGARCVLPWAAPTG